VCFLFYAAICTAPFCNAATVICCSWCHESLRFTHGFLNYHMH
jgi:hypothetical protein